MSTTTTQRDLIEMLVHDHREVEELFAKFEATTDPERRADISEATIAELVRHSVAEEQYLYPTARKMLPDGDEIAEHEIAEHAEAERDMKTIEALDPADPEFERLFRKLAGEIRHHLEEEETDLFPRLRSVCTADELAELGRKVALVKKISPTRPHPSAPDRPPANKVLGPLVGLVDRVRDACGDRKTEPGEV
jgi:hemerythrin superfamily protein